MNNNNSGVAFVTGFAIGLTLSLTIAFILAPSSGKETREFIKDKADDVGGMVKEATGNRRKIYSKSWKAHKEHPEVRLYTSDYERYP